MSNVIQIKDVYKEFKTDFWKKPVKVLNGVNLDIKKGEVVGLIGPNGAGKTTLIKILLGLVEASSGKVKVFDEANISERVKAKIGYLPENAYYYDFLKPEEILNFYGSLFGMPSQQRQKKISELLELVGLSHRKNRKLRFFSKGMVQRVGIAQALINDPELIVLDEPMSGLDPIGRKDVRDIIMGLKAQGRTILLASHVLSDVEALCDHVSILADGKVSASGQIEDLLLSHVDRIDITFKEIDSEVSAKQVLGEKVKVSGGQMMVSVDSLQASNDILELGRKNNFQLISVLPHKKSLEELFVENLK